MGFVYHPAHKYVNNGVLAVPENVVCQVNTQLQYNLTPFVLVVQSQVQTIIKLVQVVIVGHVASQPLQEVFFIEKIGTQLLTVK